MTRDEYLFLKNWMEIDERRQSSRPFRATDLMKQLIDKGFLQQVTQSATNSDNILVTGYVVTIKGENAIKQYQDN